MGIRIVLAAAILATPLAAQGLTAIKAGRLVDVERGEVRTNQVILVRGETIDAIQAASAPIPKGATVIDLSGYTVTPGLIDCHSHLADAIQGSSSADPLLTSQAQNAFIGVRNAKATLLGER